MQTRHTDYLLARLTMFNFVSNTGFDAGFWLIAPVPIIVNVTFNLLRLHVNCVLKINGLESSYLFNGKKHSKDIHMRLTTFINVSLILSQRFFTVDSISMSTLWSTAIVCILNRDTLQAYKRESRQF